VSCFLYLQGLHLLPEESTAVARVGNHQIPQTLFYIILRRVMILADDYQHQNLCSVALFLSIVIADGAFCGMNTPNDLAAVDVPACPEWTTPPYRTDLSHLPVLRRSGKKRCNMSTYTSKLYTRNYMVQAQINHAGHKETFSAITQDAHNTVSKEKKTTSSDHLHNISNTHIRDHCFIIDSSNCQSRSRTRLTLSAGSWRRSRA
jgi:hypothetical protein